MKIVINRIKNFFQIILAAIVMSGLYAVIVILFCFVAAAVGGAIIYLVSNGPRENLVPVIIFDGVVGVALILAIRSKRMKTEARKLWDQLRFGL